MINKFLIRTKTNLHVGSGGSNYGIIDNLVQRDLIDDFPIINSTSLKGALREYLEENLNQKSLAKTLFGNEDEGKGKFILSDAHIFALPLRATNKPYYMATSKYLLEKYSTIAREWNSSISEVFQNFISSLESVNIPIKFDTDSNCRIEEFEVFENRTLPEELITLFGSNLVVLPNNEMKYYCSDVSLPVLARNCLNNGKSENLWYEQLVPRQAMFYFFANDQSDAQSFKTQFGKISDIQIGANATVGYGRCKINTL